MIFAIDYKEYADAGVNDNLKRMYQPTFFKTSIYGANSVAHAEELFYKDHEHEDIEIRRVQRLEDSDIGLLYGPIETK